MLIDATQRSKRSGASSQTRCSLVSGTALMDDEISVLINVSSALSNVIDTMILVASVHRHVKQEGVKGEFVVNAGRVRNGVAGKESARQGVHLGVIWRVHIRAWSVRKEECGGHPE